MLPNWWEQLGEVPDMDVMMRPGIKKFHRTEKPHEPGLPVKDDNR